MEFKEATPVRIAVGRAGDRPLTETILRFRADHALVLIQLQVLLMKGLFIIGRKLGYSK